MSNNIGWKNRRTTTQWMISRPTVRSRNFHHRNLNIILNLSRICKTYVYLPEGNVIHPRKPCHFIFSFLIMYSRGCPCFYRRKLWGKWCPRRYFPKSALLEHEVSCFLGEEEQLLNFHVLLHDSWRILL